MVYLPEGEWYDYWTGEKITGGKYFLRDAPIDLCPMYLKEGTMIPMYEKWRMLEKSRTVRCIC